MDAHGNCSLWIGIEAAQLAGYVTEYFEIA
jgi:hypothetical protein